MSSEQQATEQTEQTQDQNQAGCAPSKCASCALRGSCGTAGNKSGVDPDQIKITARLANIKHTILVLSGKGGVGKSTVSAQLASALSKNDLDVGILDIDICGPSIPRMLGCEDEDVHGGSDGWEPVFVNDHLCAISIGFMLTEKDDPVIWRGPRKNGLIKTFLSDVHWGDLDYLIIDTPPGTSDEHMSIVQFLRDGTKHIDGAVVVTTPQEVSCMAVRKEINFCRKSNIPIIGVVENMSSFVCPDCHKSHALFASTTGGATKMCEQMKTELLGKIPMDPRVCQLCDEGKSVTEAIKGTPVATAIEDIVKEIRSKCEKPRKE